MFKLCKILHHTVIKCRHGHSLCIINSLSVFPAIKRLKEKLRQRNSQLSSCTSASSCEASSPDDGKLKSPLNTLGMSVCFVLGFFFHPIVYKSKWTILHSHFWVDHVIVRVGETFLVFVFSWKLYVFVMMLELYHTNDYDCVSEIYLQHRMKWLNIQ